MPPAAAGQPAAAAASAASAATHICTAAAALVHPCGMGSGGQVYVSWKNQAIAHLANRVKDILPEAQLKLIKACISSSCAAITDHDEVSNNVLPSRVEQLMQWQQQHRTRQQQVKLTLDSMKTEYSKKQQAVSFTDMDEEAFRLSVLAVTGAAAQPQTPRSSAHPADLTLACSARLQACAT